MLVLMVIPLQCGCLFGHDGINAWQQILQWQCFVQKQVILPSCYVHVHMCTSWGLYIRAPTSPNKFRVVMLACDFPELLLVVEFSEGRSCWAPLCQHFVSPQPDTIRESEVPYLTSTHWVTCPQRRRTNPGQLRRSLPHARPRTALLRPCTAAFPRRHIPTWSSLALVSEGRPPAAVRAPKPGRSCTAAPVQMLKVSSWLCEVL